MNVRHSVEPEGAASRGRLIPVGAMPGASARTLCGQTTAASRFGLPARL